MKRFSQRLNDLKKEYKLNNNDIAQILGLSSVNRVYPWLKEENMPSTRYLVMLANHFNCSVEYLLGRTDDFTEKDFKQVSYFTNRLTEIMKNRNLRKIDMINDGICRPGNFNIWYKKKSDPQIETVIKLADYFKVTIDYLLGRD